MPWTEKSWDAFCSLLEHGFPGPFPEEAGDAYRALLGDYEPAEIVKALRSLIRKGGRFRPSASEIVGELTTDPTKPTFTEALSAIRQVVPIRPDSAALDRAERIHPYLAAFIRSAGLDRLRQWPIDDPEYGSVERKRLKDEWDSFVERADERVAHGLALEQSSASQLGLRRPDFAGALPGPREETDDHARTTTEH
jgi:hypothetical protein